MTSQTTHESLDIAVIGAGAVGIATALSLVERGARVDVFDRDPPAAGASYGNAGVIAPGGVVPQSLPGLWPSVPRWLLDPEGPLTVRPSHWLRFLPWALRFLAAGSIRRLPAISDAMRALSGPGADLYRQNLSGTGAEHLIVDSCYIHAFKDPAKIDLDGIGWRLRRERGVVLHQVDATELHRLEPALSPAYKAAVVMEGQARALDPGSVGRAVAAKAEALGARFHRRSVSGVHPGPDGGWRITSTDAEGQDGTEHDARIVVLAAGAWSAGFLEPLGIRIPLQGERGYHVMLAEPGITLNNSIMDTDGKFVSSSMADGIRCAGTAEFATLDSPPDWRRAEVLVRQAKRLFPEIDVSRMSRWMGTRPSFPDSLPMIGPVPGYEGLIAAFGHAHYGFNMAPATGRLVAGLITGATPNTDLAPYAVDRFA